MNLRIRVFLAFAGTFGVIPWSAAAEVLSLDQAITRSLQQSPLVNVHSAELAAARARADRDALRPPWFIATELENAAGSGALSGTDSAELTVRIGRELELGGKAAARVAVGEALISSRELEATFVRDDLRAITTIRFIEVLADQSRQELANELVELADRIRAEVDRFVQAARNPDSDLRLAEVAQAEAQLHREHAEHELASARVSLAASWGALQPDFESVTGSLATLPAVDPLEVLVSRLSTAPAEQRRAAELRLATARRALARANARPDVTLSVGVRRLEALGDHGLVIGATVPLGSPARVRLALAEGDAELAALKEQGRHDVADAHQQLFEMYQELVHARTEHEALSSSMIPKAEQAFQLSQLAFERGRLPLTQLLQTRQLLFELRGRRIDAAVRYHQYRAELHRLTATGQELQP